MSAGNGGTFPPSMHGVRIASSGFSSDQTIKNLPIGVEMRAILAF